MTRQAWIELITALLPLVLLFGGLWLFLRHSHRVYKAQVDEVNAPNVEMLALNREMLAELREIRKAVDAAKR